jgi:hypothetical protein
MKKTATYFEVIELIKTWGNEDMLEDFIDSFNEDDVFTYNRYKNFCMDYIDDLSEIQNIKEGWLYR